jgi:hypothetical protein
MQDAPDDILWISEARMFNLCELPRSTFQSWVKAGLDIEDPGGAYGLADVLAILLLVHARRYLGLEEMAGAWRELGREGAIGTMIRAACDLEEGERFDLVLEPEHGSILVARSNPELVNAVRHPGAPRPVVVLDLSEAIQLVKKSFMRLANRSPRPREKRRGRPRRKAAEVEQLPARREA